MLNELLLHVIVHGHVQGVYFRAYVEENAYELGLTGFVRNLPSGVDLEVEAEGEKPKLEALLSILKKGPSNSEIEKLTINWTKTTGKYSDFTVRG
jgi:acylphosphatase